ncbi:formate/nitrite transporter family protein [Leisingera aquaemixtae]|uniref:formate/nitrite transporter family protein n=1 Tax=Leisingera aquaemixtae TaxID=1396826 RepID=UPI0021A8220A|nr:formate/nitrite transporter family protein [Leisingera aquaemixtae]UWQ47780.1 formate/nitrite transporter family protein [Leisingera aquaemixtae]
MTPTDKHLLAEEQKERDAVEEATGLSAKLIFETIRLEGEEELRRPVRALWWSGLAAGLLISFSVWGEAILRSSLPDGDWRFIVENLGYSLGFVLVILGRMQLFTENTITTVVPVTLCPTWKSFGRTGRLWAVVLAANVTGAFIAAAFLAFTPVMSSPMADAMLALSHHATGMPWAEGLVRGIPAGVLIAALVWMLPQANGSALPLIILITWLIALGDFTHIIAGSVEMAFLMVQGELSLAPAVFRFFLPVLAGNVIGGTAVFTLLTWAQIRPEVEEAKEKKNGRLKT